jgi:hypothetical protein
LRGGKTNVLEIGGSPSANARLLSWGIDADKDEFSLLDRLIYVSRKEKVAPSRLSYDVNEAWLVDRKFVVGAVPGVDTGLIKIDDGDLDIGALDSNDRTCWTAYAEIVRDGSRVGEKGVKRVPT